MNFNVVTLFPDLFQSWMDCGLVGKAIKKKSLNIDFVNPRDFTSDLHKTVDDRPFGGGDGMIMLYDPLAEAIESLKKQGQLGRLVYLSPHGKRLTSDWAEKTAKLDQPITLLSGRYGGIDQRLIEAYVDEEISIGDYVLCGGELPAMCLMEAVARFVPGVLGNELSSQKESFQDSLLEAPQFTRPANISGQQVPNTLMGGHHKKILELRQSLALVVSQIKRPDLTEKRSLEVRKAAAELETLTDSELHSCGINRAQLKQIQEGLQ